MTRDPQGSRRIMDSHPLLVVATAVWLTAACGASDPGTASDSANNDERTTYCTTATGYMQDPNDPSRVIPDPDNPGGAQVVDPDNCDDNTNGHGGIFIFRTYSGAGHSSYGSRTRVPSAGIGTFYANNGPARVGAGLPAQGKVSVAGGSQGGRGVSHASSGHAGGGQVGSGAKGGNGGGRGGGGHGGGGHGGGG